MRLRVDLCAIVLLLAVGAAVAHANAVQDGARPDDVEIARALEVVKADPNLAAEQTINTLRWRDSDKPKSSRPPGWLAWVAGLFGWIAQSMRVLVWIAAIVLAGMLGVLIVRLVRARAGAEADMAFVAPTHVRDLDIRPESLPDDLGGAARALWDRGEQRAALALLYRGMLSRFAHVHRVPIRDSSTEGDCLVLADRHLSERPRDYARHLVDIWQRLVYAGHDIQSDVVYVLCDDFAAALDAAVAPQAVRSGGPA